MDLSRAIRPDQLAPVVDALEEVLKDLDAWDLPVSEMSRLRTHKRVLRRVLDEGTYPSGATDRRAVSNAIRDAAEFHTISGALEDARVEAIAMELKRALKGTAVQDEATRTPYQFQSQLFFGSIFAVGGLSLQIAGDHVGYPDFVVDNGTLRHGIEVKRPESEAGVDRAVWAGADQLRRVSGPGMLALDLTEVIDADPGEVVENYPLWAKLKADQFRTTEAQVHLALHRQVRGAAQAVAAVAFYSRGAAWTTDSARVGAVPVYHMRFAYRPISTTASNLRWHRGVWLGEALGAGLKAMSAEVEESRRGRYG